ncbi:MAG TPA: hypothetical protein VGL18_00340 [Actinomycetota bacterium]
MDHRGDWLALCMSSGKHHRDIGAEGSAQNTLPLWIFGAIRLGQRLPEVNVVVFFVVLFTVVPVTIAARLTGGGGVTRASAAGRAAQKDE